MVDAPKRPGTRLLKIGTAMVVGPPLLILIAAQRVTRDELGAYFGFVAIMVVVAIIGFCLLVAGAVTRWTS